MSAQVNPGKLLLLELSEDGGTTFLKVGGIRSKSVNFDNPAIDATNQSTDAIAGSDFTEAVFNGFSTVTISGDGVMDKRTSVTVVAAYKLIELATTSATRSAYLRISDGTAGGSFECEGNFIITSFELSGDIQDIEQFSISAQSCEAVSVTVTQPA